MARGFSTTKSGRSTGENTEGCSHEANRLLERPRHSRPQPSLSTVLNHTASRDHAHRFLADHVPKVSGGYPVRCTQGEVKLTALLCRSLSQPVRPVLQVSARLSCPCAARMLPRLSGCCRANSRTCHFRVVNGGRVLANRLRSR
jgi:hypothetical protein